AGGDGGFNVDSDSRKKRGQIFIRFDIISTVSHAQMSSSSSEPQSKMCTNTSPTWPRHSSTSSSIIASSRCSFLLIVI
ncbi:hypothetical protein PanWU01x14_075160, partial [Parasponia andersonii]